MAQAIYREWFVRFRYPGHEDATFVDSPSARSPRAGESSAASDALTSILEIDRSTSEGSVHDEG